MIAEDNSLLLAAMAIDLIDDVADLLLGQKRVDHIEADRRVTGQDLGEQHAARCRLYTLHDRLAIRIDGVEARLDPRMQGNGLRCERLLDLADEPLAAEERAADAHAVQDVIADLMDFGIEPIPPETIVDGAILNHSGVVDAVLRAMVALLPPMVSLLLRITGRPSGPADEVLSTAVSR